MAHRRTEAETCSQMSARQAAVLGDHRIEPQLLPSKSGKSPEEAVHVIRCPWTEVLEGCRHEAHIPIGERHPGLIVADVQGEDVCAMLSTKHRSNIVAQLTQSSRSNPVYFGANLLQEELHPILED